LILAAIAHFSEQKCTACRNGCLITSFHCSSLKLAS
jgi:hypothetical protein